MDLGWIELVIQGGALALLSAVLWGAWKLAGRLIDMMDAQIAQINASIRVQEQLLASVNALCEKIDEHERESRERYRVTLTRLEKAPHASGGE
jgi:hypothetical protein